MCSPGPLHGPLHHPRLSTCSGFFVAAPWLMKVMMMVTMVTIVFLVMMVVLTVVLMVIMVIYGDYVEKLSINSARDAFLRLTPLAFGYIWYCIMSLLLQPFRWSGSSINTPWPSFQIGHLRPKSTASDLSLRLPWRNFRNFAHKMTHSDGPTFPSKFSPPSVSSSGKMNNDSKVV